MPSDTQLVPDFMKRISVEREMRDSYMRYAMSVIVSRALPDVRDGLKPVHRRILYAMKSEFGAHKPLRKSARAVGDVMGKYHPHGDAAIYDALVRMAQDFNLSLPLIEGQGNFGSIDGDPPAAMRYTECRMEKAAHNLTDDLQFLGSSTTQRFFVSNYDDTEMEPVVLPAAFPNVLVNGGVGIAVGMASSIAPHNLGEVIDATLAMIDDPSLDVDALMRYIPGPDFPTGGIIQGRAAIREAYLTGRASIKVASVYSIEKRRGDREAIVFTEIPYAQNKTTILSNMADQIRDGKIEGISDVRDESSRTGIRIVIDVKRDADANLVVNQIRKYTSLYGSFGYNAVVLAPNRPPGPMSLVDMLKEFITFRRLVIRERTLYKLDGARDSMSRNVGFFAARSQVDEVVRLIRAAPSPAEAKSSLLRMEFPTQGELAKLLEMVDPDVEVPEVFRLSEQQATDVLGLRLSRLTGLELEKISTQIQEIASQIRGYEEILNNPATLNALMKNELATIKAKYGRPRRTLIEASGPEDLSEDDLVEQKPVVLTLTWKGYVKITPLADYREQARGGKGKLGMDTKDGDFVIKTIICNTRSPLIFFTTRGIAHTLKAYKLPELPANAKGRPIVNWLDLRQSVGETIATVLALPEDSSELEGKSMMFVTDKGDVRRNSASAFAVVNKGGKIAMKLEDDDGHAIARLIDVLMCDEGDDLVLATQKGKSVRFPIRDLRVMASRASTGVKGVSLGREDEVIGASIIRHFDASAQEREAYFDGGSCTTKNEQGNEETFSLTEARMEQMKSAEQFLLTVSALGFGKRFSTHDFRTTSRGVQGVSVGTFTANTGSLVSCFPVNEMDGIVLVTDAGQTIRTRVRDIRIAGRPTRGVRLFELGGGQKIVAVARVAADEDCDNED